MKPCPLRRGGGSGLSCWRGVPSRGGLRGRGGGRPAPGDPLAPVCVGQTVEFKLLVRFDQALQPGQFERREKAVPDSVDRPDDGHEPIGGEEQPGIGNRPFPVVPTGHRRDGACLPASMGRVAMARRHGAGQSETSEAARDAFYRCPHGPGVR